MKEYFNNKLNYVFSFFSSNMILYINTHEVISTANEIINLITSIFSLLIAIFSFYALWKNDTFESKKETFKQILKNFITKPKKNAQDSETIIEQ